MKSPDGKVALVIFIIIVLSTFVTYFAWYRDPIQAVLRETNAQTKNADDSIKAALVKPNPDAINELRRLLRDGGDIPKVKALRALDQLGDDAILAAPEMIGLLNESFGSTCQEAEMILQRFGDKLSPNADRLLDVLKNGRHVGAQTAAARLLRNCCSSAPQVLSALAVSATTDQAAGVRESAIQFAVEIAVEIDQTEELIPFLERATMDSSGKVRSIAQSWLTQFRKKSEC